MAFGDITANDVLGKPSTPEDTDSAANAVAEGAVVNTTVGITAHSTFANGNASVDYSLTSDNSGGGFKIDPNTGVVSVADPSKIDFESAPGQAYTIRVMASKNNNFSSEQPFFINVTDIAPSAPVDANPAANTVLEGTANGTAVGITASSSDINGGAVTYSLTGDTSGGGFGIDAATGVVTVADGSKIDFESSPGHAYQVTVQASDGVLANSQTFTVNVGDVPLTTPIDTNGAANSVTEGASFATRVGITAFASDPNGPAATYSLSGDTSGGGFAIDASTGVVTVANPAKIDFESSGASHSYDVTVQASNGAQTTSQTFAIGVTNTAPLMPVDIDATPNSVPEGAGSNGFTVGITASSSDINGPPVTYSLAGDTSNGGFIIDTATGIVRVLDGTKIDYETAPNHAYQINVQVSDGTVNNYEIFNIGVTDLAPSTPVDNNPAANTVAEGSPTGTGVGIRAFAFDLNGPTVSYSLAGDTSLGGFTIDHTGAVYVLDASRIDYESAPGHAYQINVMVSDGTLVNYQIFNIAVTNVAPLEPVDSNPAANIVTEGAANGSTVGVTASSTDPGGTPLTYSMAGDTSLGGFTVNSTTGVVTVLDSTKLNYETASGHAYQINVGVSDGFVTNYQIFNIAVADAAPSAPVDSNSAANQVLEGAANGTPVGITASSTDPGGGPAASYVLTDSAGGRFTINSANGVVTVANGSLLDFESAQSHNITVQATAGALSSSQVFTINVGDVNDNAPVFASGTSATTAENVSTSTAVYTASAPDADGTAANNTVTYSLQSGVNDNDLFNVNGATGAVTFKVSPDFESPTDAGGNNVYDIVVTASDGLPAHNVTRAVAITVTDLNDNAPAFTSGTTGSEAENTATSNVVYDANATDADGTAPNNTIAFSLSAGGDNDFFNINASTGEVTFKSSPNFEAPGDAGGNNVYDIVVHANDGAHDVTRNVAITVTDVNDNAPVFNSGSTASTAENVSTSTAVYTAQAPDADGTSANNTVTYSLAAGVNDNDLFNISPTTGAVTFKVSPNFESPTDAGGNNVYDIVVTASDGLPAHNATQAVAITVTDVNDNAPIFSSGTTASTAENVSTATAVYTALAPDADGTAANNTVTYSLAAGVNDNDLFNINSSSGAVTFKSSPDFENPSDAGGNNVYDIVVTASDGVPAHDATRAVAITVTDLNDNSPVFQSGTTGSQFENAPTTTIAYDADATDADGTAANNTIAYSLSGGGDNDFFNINSSNGQVTFKVSPNYEAPQDAGGNGVYDIVVHANDGTHDTTQNVAITVNDVNEPPTLTATAGNPVYSPGADLFNTVSASTIEAGQSIDQLVFTVSNVNDTDETMSIDGSPVALVDGTHIAATLTNGMDVTVAVASNIATVTISKAGGVAASTIASIVDGLTYTDASTPASGSRDVTITSLHDTGGNANGGNPTGTPNITSTILFNQPPVIDSPSNADTYATSVAENSTAVTTVHATDPDDQPVTPVQYSIVGGFEDAAKFSIDATSGALTFASAPNFESPTDVGDTAGNNTYVVKVRASDGASFDEQTITVTVTNVNEAPTANPDAASVTEAGGLANGTAGVNITSGFNAITGTGTGSVADTDPENDTLTVAGAAAGTQVGPLNTGVNTNLSTANNYGTFKILSDGSFTYTVNQTNTAVQGLRQFSDTLTDTFSYTISDGNAHTSTTTVTVTIHGQDDNPVANADTVSVTEAGGTNNGTGGTDLTGFTSNAITGAGTGNVADTDVDSGDTLRVVGVLDGNHLGDPGSVTGNIGAGIAAGAGPNDPANYGTLTFQNTFPLASGNYPNGTGDGSYNFAVNQSNATVQALDTGQHVDYVYTYKVQDAAGAQSVALLTIAINGANDAPTITSDLGGATASVNADENQTAVTTVTYTDPEVAQTHTFSIVPGDDGAKFSINSSGVLTFNTAPNYEAPTDSNADNDYVVTVKVTDSGTGALFDTQTITVHVQDVNDAPVAINHTYNGTDSAIANTALVLDDGVVPAPTDPAGPQKTISGSLLTGATDEDGDTLTVVAQNNAATAGGHGTVTVTTTGEFTYLPNPGYTGSDTFNYTVSDGNGGTDTKLVTINVATPHVWYVNADAGSDGDGTSDNPFNTLAHFQNDAAAGHNVDGANDIIFLYNASAHYTGGLTLENNETLIGQSQGLVVNGTTLEATAGSNSGTVIEGGVVLGQNDTISGVTLGNTGSGTALSGTNFGTFNVDHTAVNTDNNGMILSNGAFGSGATFSSFTSGGATDVSLTNVTGSVDLGSGTMSGLFAVSGGSVNTTYSGNLNQANNAAMVSVSGGHTGTMTFQTGTLHASNGTGLQFDNADGNYNFNGTNTLNNTVGGVNANAGVDIVNGSNGNFSFSSNTSITGQNSTSETAFNVAGGGQPNAGTITYAGTIGTTSASTDNAGTSVSITGRTGGSVTLSGNVLDSNDSGGGIGISNDSGTITFSGSNKTLNTGTGDAVSISNGGTVNFTNGGLDIDTTNGTGFLAGAGGTITVGGNGNTINTTGTGAALNLSSVTVAAGGITFDTTTSTGSGARGVNIDTVTGTGDITLGTGTLSGHSTTEFDINAGSGNISYAGTIGNGSGDSIQVTGHTSGTVGFSGNINDTNDAGGGIVLTGNTGGTYNFSGTTKTLNTTTGAGVTMTGNSAGVNVNFTNGGLDIDTTSGNGFVATGNNGATLTVTGAGNHLTSTAGGTALNIANTTIGSNEVTFHDISSSAASSGIILNTTGSSGGLNVTGDNTTSRDGSGGTITGSTGNGVSLTSTSQVSLQHMNINNSGTNGIFGSQVNGFVSDWNSLAGNGNAVNEGGIRFGGTLDTDPTGLTGGAIGSATETRIDHTLINTSFEHGLVVENTTGTLTQLNLTGTTIQNDANGSGFLIETRGTSGSTAAATVQIEGSSFLANPGAGVQGNALRNTTLTMNILGNAAPGTNTFTGHDTILLGNGDTGHLVADIRNNTISGNGNGIFVGNAVSATSGATLSAKIVSNNVTTNAGGANHSISSFMSGGTSHLLIDSNTVVNNGQSNGINVGTPDDPSGPNFTAIVTNNTVTNGGSAANGISLSADVSGPGATSVFKVENNTVNWSSPSVNNLDGIFLNQFGTSTVALERGGSASNTASVVLAANNPNAHASGAGGAATTVSGTVTVVANGTITAPMLAAAGGIAAATPAQAASTGDYHLTQAELDTVVAAAIAQWAHAGASAGELAALRAATFTVADLSDNTISDESLGHIRIDSDAAGHGWFVDPTPNDNSEFTHAQNAAGTDLLTDPGSNAAGHMDLLTAVSHELGHVLGLADTATADTAHSLMYIDLVEGERRMPDATDVAHANLLQVAQIESNLPPSAQAAAGTPVVSGTAGNDTLSAGHGGTILFGGAGADNFAFGTETQVNKPATAQVTHVADYSAAQGDTFDFSALTSAFHTFNVSDALLVRAVEDASGKFATLQVDSNIKSALASAPDWVSIAQIDGAHAGDAVNVWIDSHSAVHLAQLHVDLLT